MANNFSHLKLNIKENEGLGKRVERQVSLIKEILKQNPDSFTHINKDVGNDWINEFIRLHAVLREVARNIV